MERIPSFLDKLRDVSVSAMPRLVLDAVPTNELNALLNPPDTFSASSLQMLLTQVLSLNNTAEAPFCPNMRKRLVGLLLPMGGALDFAGSSAKLVPQKMEKPRRASTVFLIIICLFSWCADRLDKGYDAILNLCDANVLSLDRQLVGIGETVSDLLLLFGLQRC